MASVQMSHVAHGLVGHIRKAAGSHSTTGRTDEIPWFSCACRRRDESRRSLERRRSRPTCLRQLADVPRRLRQAYCHCLTGPDLLNHRLVQERPFACAGSLSEAPLGRSGLLDLEGRNEHDPRPLGDHRLVWLGRLVENLLRGAVGISGSACAATNFRASRMYATQAASSAGVKPTHSFIGRPLPASKTRPSPLAISSVTRSAGSLTTS